MTGWRNEPLSAVCEFINRGVSPKYVESGGIAVLNQKCVRDHEVNYALGRRHDADLKRVSPERLLRAGDVLVNSTGTGTLGRVAQLRSNPAEPTTVDSHVTIVRPIPRLFHPEFFGYALIAIEDQIQAGGEGCGGQTELSRTKLADEYRVGFPVDLSEQRRIVAILDEAFEGIATAKANAEKNLQNARELFDNALQSLLRDSGGERVQHNLAAVCDILSKLVDPREETYQDLPHVGAGNIEAKTGELIDVLTARQEQLISGKFLFDASMVLYSKIRPYLMKVVRPDFSGLCSADIYPLSPTPGVITRDYLFYVLLSPEFTEYAIKGSARAGMPKVNREHLFAYELSLPSVQEQERIASTLDGLADETQRLIAVYERKLTALEELKKSLLHQAFSGQL
jgi:type I restriction enzyme, S subunit